MPKAKDARADKAFEMYKQGLLLKDIAKQLEVAEGTVRSWKNRYKWDGEGNATLQKNNRNVAKEKGSRKKNKKEAVADEVETVIQNTELTDKQQLFCIYYIRCFNATKAYQKAYECDYISAMQNGSRMLRNDKVKEEILKLKQEKLNREFFSESDIFQKYMDIAFADMSDFAEFGKKEVEYIDKAGNERSAEISYVNLKDSDKVDGTLITEVSQGKDGVKIKLADRMKAMKWLSDHMDLATEEQKAKIAVLKAKVETDITEEDADDGFIDALNNSAGGDWTDEEEN